MKVSRLVNGAQRQYQAGFTEWVASGPYVVGDVVWYNDNCIYRCLVGNTDGVFIFSKWQRLGGNGSFTIKVLNISTATTGTWNTGMTGSPIIEARYWDSTNNEFNYFDSNSLDLDITALGGVITYDTTDVVFLSGSDYIELSAYYVNSVSFAGLYDAIVGDTADVDNGIAQYSSIATAITNVAAGGSIFLLNRTFTENIVLNKTLTIVGKGNSSNINGTLTMQSGADYCTIKNVRFAGNVTINSGSDGNFLRECFMASGTAVTDNGTGNSVLVITE